MRDDRTYCVVSPCRNEALFLERTVESMAQQTILPQSWIIVDDGSTDSTPKLLREAAERHPWIQVVRRIDRGTRTVGPGVVEAFFAGYERVKSQDWEYVCKLDMDLELPPGYFEALIYRMESDPRLGSASGQAYYRDAKSGMLISEGISPEMSVGASKFYRRRCFDQIGGFVRAVMWDGIDCHRARMMGWKVRSFDEASVRFLHLRPMGSSHRGIWTGRVRHGYGQYFMGTGLLFMTASALFRMTRRPVFLGGLAMGWGYLKSLLRRERRIPDPEFRKFLRRYQLQMLLKGKERATEAVEAERAPVWGLDHEPVWKLGAEGPAQMV